MSSHFLISVSDQISEELTFPDLHSGFVSVACFGSTLNANKSTMIASPAAAATLLPPLAGVDETEKVHVTLPDAPSHEVSGMSPQQVWQWYNSHPLLIGFNYIPRYAVNFMEMWIEEKFDIVIIEEELSWAVQRGYNSLRTNIPMCLYEDDCEGLTSRINTFLDVCQRHNISVMLCPLDDCEFGGLIGKESLQEPIPRVHNSRAVGSPGRAVILDPSQWHRVESFIRYVIRTWGGDSRILLWDLWNEPGNSWEFTPTGTRVIDQHAQFEENALRLMELVFTWARQEYPLQPLSTSAWHVPDPFFDNIEEDSSPMIALSHPIDQRAMQLSDVITIHAYCGEALLRSILTKCSLYNKPLMLTEWMARHADSRFENLLPVLEEFQVGSYQWGLVAGRSQTYLPWPHVAEKFQDSQTWFHDVLNADGTAHDVEEMAILKNFSSTVQDRILARRGKKAVVQTKEPIIVHTTMPTIMASPTVTPTIRPAAHYRTPTPLDVMLMSAVVEIAAAQQQQHNGADCGITTSTVDLGDEHPNLLY